RFPSGSSQLSRSRGELPSGGTIGPGSEPAQQRSALTVKKVTLSAATLLLAGIGCIVGIAWGQGEQAAPPLPHKIGLIDLNHLFVKYDKFLVLREDLKLEFEAAELKMKGDYEKIRELQNTLKEYD